MSQLSESIQIATEISRDETDAKLRSLKIKRWLRTDELALYLGTTQGAIRNMVMRGKLSPKKCFGRNFFDRDHIDELIETSAWAATPATPIPMGSGLRRRNKWR